MPYTACDPRMVSGSVFLLLEEAHANRFRKGGLARGPQRLDCTIMLVAMFGKW